jgi:tetratricopeptide (TPR) repeat protein
VNRLFSAIITICVIVAITQLIACSSESNTWTSKAFHNTTAHYNGYYYAREEITKIENTIRKSQKDDYNNVLPLFSRLDSVLALSYDNEIQEAIKMASIAIQRHPNSKWVDDSYILVGKARLYSLDWGNAIQTFKYVNTKGADAATRHRALIILARTFTEHGEYGNAEATFDFLAKAKLNKTNRKNLLLEKAHHYQVRDDDDKFVRNLTEAVPLLTKKDRPGRIYFILGQVYQKLGFEAEAYNYFRECLQTHPEYEVDFYARLYMAQVAEISKSRNIANARKSFRKLLKDPKNREFKDKIYYEMGVFERKQDNIDQAIGNYQLAIREGNNKQIDGEAYLRLGEIYYDTLKKYEVAKAYYDSAVAALPKSYEDYDMIKVRQETLDEFVFNLKTIEWQDSLLVLANLDSAALMAHITAVLESQKVPETKSRKKSKRARIDIAQVSTTFGGGSGFEGTDWYFGNPSALALGQQEFMRVWGSIPLEDNWRRSARATPITARPAIIPTGELQDPTLTEEPAPTATVDPVLVEYNRIEAQLPKNEEDTRNILGKIEEAYFNLGDIYYFKLLEKENAIATFQKLITRFTDTAHRPEVLYKLYLICKELNRPEMAEQYADELKLRFPESSFAKILINPDYLVEASIVIEKQKLLYKSAYEDFEAGDFTRASGILDAALKMEKTTFTPNLELLRILVLGKTEPMARYQHELENFVISYPETELSAYAKKLLTTSRDFEAKLEKEKGIRYLTSFDEPHYFVAISRAADNLEDLLSKAMAGFNQAYYKDSNLKISTLVFNDTHSILLVTDLHGKSKAMDYYRMFTEKRTTLTALRNHKFDTFVITKDNFDIFYRTKGLDEYFKFFERNYFIQSP